MFPESGIRPRKNQESINRWNHRGLQTSTVLLLYHGTMVLRGISISRLQVFALSSCSPSTLGSTAVHVKLDSCLHVAPYLLHATCYMQTWGQ